MSHLGSSHIQFTCVSLKQAYLKVYWMATQLKMVRENLQHPQDLGYITITDCSRSNPVNVCDKTQLDPLVGIGEVTSSPNGRTSLVWENNVNISQESSIFSCSQEFIGTCNAKIGWLVVNS